LAGRLNPYLPEKPCIITYNPEDVDISGGRGYKSIVECAHNNRKIKRSNGQ
jgi:hypothetical protein